MEQTESTSAIPSEPKTTVSEASTQECDPHDANANSTTTKHITASTTASISEECGADDPNCNQTKIVDTTTSATTDEETSTGGASSTTIKPSTQKESAGQEMAKE